MNPFKRNIRLPRVIYDHIPGFHIGGGLLCLFAQPPIIVGLGAIAYGSWVAYQRRSSKIELKFDH